MICCRDCDRFIPDKIGDGYGIGRCRAYEQYKRANESQSALKMRLLELGNNPDSDVFLGGLLADRECNRFKEKIK